MSLADFLDPCPTCDQKGYVVVEHTRVVPHHPSCAGGLEHCPDCIGGLVPSETDIEAVKKVIIHKIKESHDGFDPQSQLVGVTADDIARAAVTTLIRLWRTR